jgi:hypothetical protein
LHLSVVKRWPPARVPIRRVVLGVNELVRWLTMPISRTLIERISSAMAETKIAGSTNT